MKFSCLVCTSNSERLMREVLSALLGQTRVESIAEVIVADYQSKDSTLALAREIIGKSAVPLIELACELPGKTPSMMAGLDRASGDFVIIVDDDNVLSSDFIENAVLILQDATIGCLGAQGMTDHALSRPVWFDDFQMVYAIGLPERGLAADWVWGAASIVRKAAWTKLREHDFELVLNPVRKAHATPIAIGGEDVELSLAVQLAGFRVESSQALTFWHKFEQRRVTEDYLYRNSLGVSRAVPIHEIYRAVLGSGTGWGCRALWARAMLRKLLGCLVGIVVVRGENAGIKRRVRWYTARGILAGCLMFGGSVGRHMSRLRRLRKYVVSKSIRDNSVPERTRYHRTGN